MLIAPAALALLALALAWPVPLWLSAAQWPTRSPALALVLWQSIALAGGLSMIGALLTFGLLPFGTDLVQGVIGFVDSQTSGTATGRAGAHHIAALLGACLLSAHLLLNLGLTVTQTMRDRHRHRHLLELLTTPDPSRTATRILDLSMPVAYCLPIGFRSVIVFSAGLVELLNPDELRAVTEHEHAHAHQRHDVVLMAFRAWHTSLPWFPVTYQAEREVRTLIEMLADDHARGFVDDTTLARAIALVGNAAWPGGAEAVALGHREGDLLPTSRTRITRLTQSRSTPVTQQLLVIAAAIAILGVPTALLLLPAALGS